MENLNFYENLLCKLGKGELLDFQNSRWLGTQQLKHVFPNLFYIVHDKEGKVQDMGEWNGEDWNWKINILQPIIQTQI